MGADDFDFDSILNSINPHNPQQTMPHYRRATRTINGQDRNAIVFAFNHPSLDRNWYGCPNPAISVAIICFDLASTESFEQAKVWIERAKASSITEGFITSSYYKYSDNYGGGPSLKEYKFILVGNKNDTSADSVITDAQINQLKAQYQINEYMEINTKNGTNIEALLQKAMHWGATFCDKRYARMREQASSYMNALLTLHKFHNNLPMNIAAGVLLTIGLIGVCLAAASVIGVSLTVTSITLAVTTAGFFIIILIVYFRHFISSI